jgi:predicted permease
MRRTFRRLSANRALFCAVVVSLGVGIGGTTAVFGLIYAVMLKPLPVRDAGRLVSVSVNAPSGSQNTLHSYQLFLSLRDGNRDLSGFLARVPTDITVGSGGTSERVSGELISGNYFDLLGVQPAAGRLLTSADDTSNEAVCVMSYGLWKRMFGASPDVVGRPLTLNGHLFTVIGVTSSEFRGVEQGASPDIRVPLSMVRTILGPGEWNSQGNRWLYLLGRLRTGVSREQAEAGLQPLVDIATGTAAQSPEKRARIALLAAEQGFASLRYIYGRPLTVLMSVVTLAFLLACLNVLILLCARITSRSRDIATCIALGAGRARLLWEFTLEGVWLGLGAGAVGAVLGHWASRSIVGLLPASNVSYFGNGSWDLRWVTFTIVLSLISGCLLSASMAAFTLRSRRISPLGEWDMAASRGRLLQALVAAQMAISLVLVMSALLFVGTLYRLQRLDLGFKPGGLVLSTIDPSLRGRGAASVRFYQELIQRVRALPAVDSVSLARVGVLSGQMLARDVDIPGRHLPDADQVGNHYWNKVTPAYFQTMAIPIQSGRDFQPSDQQGSPRVAIVNQRMAKRYWPGEDSVGKRFTFGKEVEIVGVVGDSKYLNLREPNPLIVYTPLWQSDVSEATLHVRTTADPDALMGAIRREVAALDNGITVYSMITMQTQIDDLLVRERLLARLSILLGVLALVLATGGLYSTVAYSVERRSRELAIRMALGADRAGVLRLLLRENSLAVTTGVVAGALSFLAIGRLLSGLLFGVQPTDFGIIATVVGVFGAVALLATLGPALHVTAKEPAIGLRHDQLRPSPMNNVLNFQPSPPSTRYALA